MFVEKVCNSCLEKKKGLVQGRSQGARPPQSKCCFRFLSWILAEMCLKYIILITNFQKSPRPLNLQFWWAKVT